MAILRDPDDPRPFPAADDPTRSPIPVSPEDQRP